MKGITYCGACADYDIKKHRCKRGAKLESNPQDKFFDDCPLPDAVPVVHGRWVAQCVVETDGGWTLEDAPYNEYQHSNPICSICRKTALLDGGEDYVASPYCPNCGARMDGGSDG